nr:MAG TPA: hypothetical protein [Herelleviridae sp.]
MLLSNSILYVRHCFHPAIFILYNQYSVDSPIL